MSMERSAMNGHYITHPPSKDECIYVREWSELCTVRRESSTQKCWFDDFFMANRCEKYTMHLCTVRVLGRTNMLTLGEGFEDMGDSLGGCDVDASLHRLFRMEDRFPPRATPRKEKKRLNLRIKKWGGLVKTSGVSFLFPLSADSPITRVMSFWCAGMDTLTCHDIRM